MGQLVQLGDLRLVWKNLFKPLGRRLEGKEEVGES